MATSTRSVSSPAEIIRSNGSSCDLVASLMKLQRAAQLITSTLDLDALLDRVVNDLAVAIVVWK
jgi:sigma-B regulation protein RsbU (phosphoserine phosphatase)